MLTGARTLQCAAATAREDGWYPCRRSFFGARLPRGRQCFAIKTRRESPPALQDRLVAASISGADSYLVSPGRCLSHPTFRPARANDACPRLPLSPEAHQLASAVRANLVSEIFAHDTTLAPYGFANDAR